MEGHVFNNWAETHSCRPELYFEPHDQQQLRQVITGAPTDFQKLDALEGFDGNQNLA